MTCRQKHCPCFPGTKGKPEGQPGKMHRERHPRGCLFVMRISGGVFING